MDLETAQTTITAKLSVLKQGEYDMWRLRIKQYFQVQDCALWDVIENGNSFKLVAQTTTNVVGTSTSLIPGPVTTEEKVQKKNDVKARKIWCTANDSNYPASTQVSTASTQVSTANLSDATVYAFLANQPNGSQLVHEDLKQIHKDDLEEMDLNDTAGYDNSKNQDSSKRTINVEETSSKAMMAIDGAGFDWSYMADDEVPANIALMAFSDSEEHGFQSRPKAVNIARPNSAVVNVVRENQVNAIKASACWVWRPTKLNSASIYIESRNYVDAKRHIQTLKEFDEDKYLLGEEPKEGKLLEKELLKNMIGPKCYREKSMEQSHSNSNETISSQDYIFMPLWKDGSLFDSSSKNANNDEPQPPSDAGKKDDEGVCKESGIDDQERPKNSTQDINNARPSINTKPDMFSLGDNVTLEATHADGDETEVDMSNITTTYPVPSTLNTRIYKDHSLDHVIGDVQSSVQYKEMDIKTDK
ncbi:hypothetical protein Tco_1084309 [Tanacetum coccineum]